MYTTSLEIVAFSIIKLGYRLASVIKTYGSRTILKKY